MSTNPGQDYTPREILLVAASRAVLSAFRETLEQKRLSAPGTATLRVLEAALELYGAQDSIIAPTTGELDTS